MKELRDAITGKPINWTDADAREGNLCYIEGIAEKLPGSCRRSQTAKRARHKSGT